MRPISLSITCWTRRETRAHEDWARLDILPTRVIRVITRLHYGRADPRLAGFDSPERRLIFGDVVLQGESGAAQRARPATHNALRR